MHLAARFFTGGVFPDGLISVAHGRDQLLKAVAAGGTDQHLPAFPVTEDLQQLAFIIMVQRRDRLGIAVTATGAGVDQRSVLFTAGLPPDTRIAVSHGRDRLGIAVTTGRADIHRQTVLITEDLRPVQHVPMPQRRDRLGIAVTTTFTGIQQTAFGLTVRLCPDTPETVAHSRDRLGVAVAAKAAGIAQYALSLTAGCHSHLTGTVSMITSRPDGSGRPDRHQNQCRQHQQPPVPHPISFHHIYPPWIPGLGPVHTDHIIDPCPTKINPLLQLYGQIRSPRPVPDHAIRQKNAGSRFSSLQL